MLTEAAHAAGEGRTMILAIDQAEELFDTSDQSRAEEAREFLDALLALLTTANEWIKPPSRPNMIPAPGRNITVGATPDCRANRGHNPARRKEDLPTPEGAMTVKTREPSRSLRRSTISSASASLLSRPKNTPASFSVNASRPG